MEDNIQFEKEGVMKRKSRISSILKPTFGPLLDLDPNQQTEENVTPQKKPRRSSSKRVSFAHRSEVKEFARDSPHEKWTAPDLHSGQDENTSEKNSRTCEPISSGTFQAVVNTTVNKYTGISLVETDTFTTSSAVSSKGLASSNLTNRQPLGCLTDSISRIPQGRFDDNLPINEDENEKGLIDQKDFLMSLSGNATSNYKENETMSPSGLSKGILIDGGAFLRSLASDRPQENTPDLGQENPVFFDNDMEHTEALTCHIQLPVNNKHDNTGIKRKSFLNSGAGGGSAFFKSDVGGSNVTGQVCSTNDQPTRIFDCADEMEQTEVLSGYIQVDKEKDSDEGIYFKAFPHVQEGKQISLEKTCIFQDENDVEETQMLHRTIVLNTEEKPAVHKGMARTRLFDTSIAVDRTLLFPQGTDMEETKVIQNKIQDGQNLTMGNVSLSTNQTLLFPRGTDMEETKVIQNKIQDGQNLTMGNMSSGTNQTLLFPQGTDMEETKVIQNKIQDGQNFTMGNASLSTNQTRLFPQGTDMEETKVIQNKIQDGQNLTMRNMSSGTNQTLLFPQGTDMEETKVIQNKIQDGENLTMGNASLSTNQTRLFPHGTDMEETKVIQNKIQDGENLTIGNASLSTNQTRLFPHGTDMEETKVIQNKIQDGQNLTMRNMSSGTNQTLLFPQGTDMEETRVIQNAIRDGRNLTMGNASSSTNQTLLFPRGTDMEETKVIQNKIQDGQNLTMGNASLSTNQTRLFPQGTDMEETKVIQNKIQDGQNLTMGNMSSGTNQTLLFPQGTDMEETRVIQNAIRDSHNLTMGNASGNANKTLLFPQGTDMEETKPYTGNISLCSEDRVKKTEIYQHGSEMAVTNILRADTDLSKSNAAVHRSQHLTGGETELVRDSSVMHNTSHTFLDESPGDRVHQEVGKKPLQIADTNVVFQERNEIEETAVVKQADVLKAEDLGKQDGDNLTTCMNTNITSTHNATGVVPDLLEPIRTGDFPRRSVTGPVGLTLLQQARDKKQTPSKNKIRLSTPAKSTEKSQDLLAQSVLSKENTQGLSVESSEAQGCSDERANGNTRVDNSQDLNETVNSPAGKSKLEDILALDAGIDQILPPDDMMTNLSLQSSMITNQSDIGHRLGTSIVQPFISFSNESHMDRNNTVDGMSNHSRAESNQTINSSIIGCSLTNSRLEDMQQEMPGTMSVEFFCKFLGVGQLRWRSNFQLQGYRCSMPVESVDMSDLKGKLQAQTIHHPYYELYNQVYTHATQQAIEKKKECERLDQVYADQPPEIFLYTQTCTREQRDVLSEKVASLRKTCLQHGNKEWKALRLSAAKPYLGVLQKNHRDLQNQYEELQTANRDVDITLSDLRQSIEEQEGKEESKLVMSQEGREEWLSQQRELSHLQSTLQDEETERCRLETERNRLKKEIEEMMTANETCEDSQEDLQTELEQLQRDEHQLQRAVSIYERCLEWRIENNEKFRKTFCFYEDTFYLEVILEPNENRTLVSAELTSCLPEDASPEMKLAHNLIQSAVTEQQILTKYQGTPEKEISSFLSDFSWVMMEGRCLAREISSISFNNYTSYKESSVCVEFLSQKSLRKVDVTFDLKLIVKGYTVTPHVQIDIGDISCDAVVKQLESVPKQGLEYFTRLCDSINLDTVDSPSAVPP